VRRLFAGSLESALEIAHSLEERVKPFLKWVGGKRQLLKYLRPRYPSSFNRFFEPFVGGGAVFFDLHPELAVLADTNRELIDCYLAVVDRLRGYIHDSDHYYRTRAQDPFALDEAERAARMIYLNRTGYNGLYRVNSKGQFNVPFGRHVNPTICNEEGLRACSQRLAGATIEAASFETVLAHADTGDFVYFDPPYVPLSSTSNFTAYERNGFGMGEQRRLADVFDELAARGVFVMLSNSDVGWIRERYAHHNIEVVRANRNVNSDGSGRGPIGEVVVTSYR
jgi:DNA adenine methylase